MPRKKTAPSPPRLLAIGTSPEEKALAEEIAAMLPEPLTPADHVAFVLLTTKLAEWRRLFQTVFSVGITQESDRSGVAHLSPEARREAEVFAEVVALCKEFGMTPRSRARMAAALGKEAASAKPPVFCGFISADPGKPAE